MTDGSNTAEPGKPRRHWFQFRLRTLLILIAVLAILFPLAMWLGREWQELRAMDRLILEGVERR